MEGKGRDKRERNIVVREIHLLVASHMRPNHVQDVMEPAAKRVVRSWM